MRPTKITLPAPGKINRFLHIIGQRTDGYHLLQTLFQFIDLADELRFTVRQKPDISVHCENTALSSSDNLVVRAAKLLQIETKVSQGAIIQLKKNLPIGAGVGGGSSDAATTLLALNYLWQTNLNLAELEKLGLQLGADVPVFIRGKAAWAEGIGEQLTPVEINAPWCVLFAPRCHVNTQTMYKLPNLPRSTPRIDFDHFLSQGGHNDFETVVRQHHPEVNQVFEWLSTKTPAYLSGSGACVFILFEDKTVAMDFQTQVPKSFPSFLCQIFNISPLHIALNRLI